MIADIILVEPVRNDMVRAFENLFKITGHGIAYHGNCIRLLQDFQLETMMLFICP